MRFKLNAVLVFSLFIIVFLIQLVLLNWSWKCPICQEGTNIQEKNQVIEETKLIAKSQPVTKKETSKTSELEDLEIFSANTWIINNKVAQYGAKLILMKDEELIIEALAFFDTSVQTGSYIQSKAFQCLVKIDDNIHSLNVIEAINMESNIVIGTRRYLWRIRCRADKSLHQWRFKDIRLAITDNEEYKKMKKELRRTERFISFQSANFFNSSVTKKKSVAHCVHMMFDLDGVRQKRLFNWHDVQQRLGVDRYRFYFFRVNETSERAIKERLGDRVEIFHTQLGRPFICRHYIAYSERHPLSNLAKYLLDNCDALFKSYFDWSRDGVFNIHEKVCTNDCLLTFKWQYEFTTNYDFDEFIFPRLLRASAQNIDPRLLGPNNTSNSSQDRNCGLLNQEISQYSLYEYAKRLNKIANGKVAVFRFKHVVFMHNDHMAFLKKLFASNVTITKEELVDYYYMNTNKKIIFKVLSYQKGYIDQIRSSQEAIECLNKTISKNEMFDSIWNSPYAIHVNNRFGKSIFNTDLTETYNQHHSDVNAPDSMVYDVPMELGYASHYREYIDGFFFNQIYSFNHFFVDIEYYKYLANFK